MLVAFSNFFKILFTDAFWICFHFSVRHTDPKIGSKVRINNCPNCRENF